MARDAGRPAPRVLLGRGAGRRDEPADDEDGEGGECDGDHLSGSFG